MNAIREKIESIEEDTDFAAASEVEAGIRDFVRNDVAYLRRPAPGLLSNRRDGARAGHRGHRQQCQLADRARRRHLARRDRKPIGGLESLRDLLHAEGQRVQREISGYAQLSQAAMKSTRMIADNVAQWKRTADGLRNG